MTSRLFWSEMIKLNVMPYVIKSIQIYGEDITVINDDDTVLTRAFIEPLRYRNKIYIGGGYRTLGMKHSEKYLYIGIPDVPLVVNDDKKKFGGGEKILA